MSAVEPLCKLIGINPHQISKEENLILEADLFTRICEELKEIFREQFKNYFRLLKLTIEKENHMLESNFVRLIIKDILSTEEYTMSGIAQYADIHEDVVDEVIAGRNTNPSAIFLRKVIELHRSVRCDVYNLIIKKVAAQYLSVA